MQYNTNNSNPTRSQNTVIKPIPAPRTTTQTSSSGQPEAISGARMFELIKYFGGNKQINSSEQSDASSKNTVTIKPILAPRTPPPDKQLRTT